MASLRFDLAEMIMLMRRYFDDLSFVLASRDAPLAAPLDCRWPGLYSLQFLRRGALWHGRDGQGTTLLQAPALYWIDPSHTYQLAPHDGTDRRHVVNFRGARGERLIARGFDHLSTQGWMPVMAPKRLEAFFALIEGKAMLPDARAHAEAVILLEQLLAALDGEADADPAVHPHRATVLAVARRIQESPWRRESPAGLAKELHLSYSHFRRLFRQYLQQSPASYILCCRMRAAAEWMRDPMRQIKDIASDAGYDDPAQFTRAFRRHMGLSPQEYRRAGF